MQATDRELDAFYGISVTTAKRAEVVKRQEAAYDAHDLVEDISEKAEQLLAAIKAGNLHEAGWRIACARGATIERRVNIELHGVKA